VDGRDDQADTRAGGGAPADTGADSGRGDDLAGGGEAEADLGVVEDPGQPDKALTGVSGSAWAGQEVKQDAC